MRRSRSVEHLTFDPEIERTLTRLRKAHKEDQGRAVMAGQERDVDHRALREFALPQQMGMPAAIRRAGDCS